VKAPVKQIVMVSLLILSLVIFSCASVPEIEIDTSIQLSPSFITLQAEAISIAEWGYDPNDATEFFQAALDSEVNILLVPQNPGPWIVDPLVLPSNKTIIFEAGSEVIAKKDSYFGGGDSVFKGHGIENLTIYGYGASVRMHKTDYQNPPYNRAEWRHCFDLRGVSNVTLEGLELLSSGGDGVYLGSNWGAEITYNRNVLLKNLEIHNQHRQGISVISIDGLIIEGTSISGTSGTMPASGIDFEPNRHYEILKNIQINNCRIFNNAGQGVLIQLKKLDSSSEPIDITISDSYILNNFYNIALMGTFNEPKGVITLNNVSHGLFTIFLTKDDLKVIEL
jgi:hypothetical protein